MISEAILTWKLLQEARAASRRPQAWFRARQESGMKRLLIHAYQKVPLYQRLYNAAGFNPESFRTLEDLPRIPPLTKALLKQTRAEDSVALGTNLSHCQLVSTSGSTGMPLQIVLGPYERCWHRAVAWRVLFEHGFRWTDRTLEIRMALGPIQRIQKLGIAPKDWGSILDPPAKWAHQLAQRRHECVVAGAGTLELLAEAVTGGETRPPRIVISDSEPLTPRARAQVHAKLGTDPVDVYGLVEVSNFAWQCEQRDQFHVSADSHIVEVAAPPGQTGNLLVTALGMWTMPMIRYETGDLAEIATQTCPCGRTLPGLKAVHGRAVDSIRLGNGRYLLWPYFHELLGTEQDLLEWQVCQETPRDLLVKAVLRSPDTNTVKRIESRLRCQLPTELRVKVESVSSIPAERNGKRKLIVPLGDV